MYAVLGEIEFDVVAYWDEFESTMGVDYTSHARIEGKPGVQFIGDKLDKITLKFNFHSQYCQPTTELNRLREAMTAHQAMALVFGNGDYRGWFVITDLTATHQHTDPYGNVIAQGGSLSLQEYTGDPKSPLLPPAITTQEPNIDEMLDELPDVNDSWFDELLSVVEEGMREAKEMMDEVADAIDDIKKTIAQAKELVKEAKALKEKCGDIVDSLKKNHEFDRRAVPAAAGFANAGRAAESAGGENAGTDRQPAGDPRMRGRCRHAYRTRRIAV
ncbi:methyl-accepting chemotaxis protein [Salmonella enterica subsp. enterica serovar Heidelberg]|nr:methyl-accepting chemotaxis protein [Salmonella enterica subsp. enterica serovar Heidelberg]